MMFCRCVVLCLMNMLVLIFIILRVIGWLLCVRLLSCLVLICSVFMFLMECR